jgi:hypothetical protein
MAKLMWKKKVDGFAASGKETGVRYFISSRALMVSIASGKFVYMMDSRPVARLKIEAQRLEDIFETMV